ncbi:hypothetical protein P152DRAFT_315429 [Eremomyces bilateralis CBS 781.70]|uniref:Uncharacterized protein n=1 Tax=Eremomyces bilateralis CBS 781.70 TaxID=1392243 RepID=A0A6G1G5W9_9PEZI|nr:uncharacterized protein P152DRAFT_315429 [Eremomyces bilateralis CBS 781.70]KAF1813341.1 hypothetical protein P152DRAFT_315429 [Eremomyces bilateralis CBS 781.70]
MDEMSMTPSAGTTVAGPNASSEDTRHTEQRRLFQQATEKVMGRPGYYTDVTVLMFKWTKELEQRGGLNEGDYVQKLSEVFADDFRFETKIIQLEESEEWVPTKRVIDAINIIKGDTQNTLIIIYYNGHGKLDLETKQLKWHATNHLDKPGSEHHSSVYWQKIENYLNDNVFVDVLAILDTCYAGNIGHKDIGGSDDRNYQLLTAGAFDKRAESGEQSFTNALVECLQILHRKHKGRPFELVDLQEEITHHEHRKKNPPSLLNRRRKYERPIKLAPLHKPDGNPAKENQVAPPCVAYLHLRLPLTDHELDNHAIEKLGRKLGHAIKETQLPISRVEWEGIKPMVRQRQLQSLKDVVSVAYFMHNRLRRGGAIYTKSHQGVSPVSLVLDESIHGTVNDPAEVEKDGTTMRGDVLGKRCRDEPLEKLNDKVAESTPLKKSRRVLGAGDRVQALNEEGSSLTPPVTDGE